MCTHRDDALAGLNEKIVEAMTPDDLAEVIEVCWSTAHDEPVPRGPVDHKRTVLEMIREQREIESGSELEYA